MKVRPEFFRSRGECSDTCRLFLALLGKELQIKYGIRHLRTDVSHDVHGYYHVDSIGIETNGSSKIRNPCYIHVQTYPGFSDFESGVCLAAWRKQEAKDTARGYECLIYQNYFSWDSEEKIADTLAEKVGA
jgi:hypothetical protein